jgi:hypothetical protein
MTEVTKMTADEVVSYILEGEGIDPGARACPGSASS